MFNKISTYSFYLAVIAFLFLIPLSGWTEENKQNILDPSKIKNISYMLASEKGSGRSSFGHAYLRLSESDQFNRNDLVVEFLMDASEDDMNTPSGYLKAIGLGIEFSRKTVITQFSIVEKEMNFLQNRDITSYSLKLNEIQINKIVQTINELIYFNDGKHGYYNFLTSNCASAISDIFESIGIEISGITHVIPSWIPDYLKENNLIKDSKISYSKSNRRLQLINKYQTFLKSIPSPFNKKTIELFSSEDELERLFISLYLIKTNLDINIKISMSEFLNSFILLENAYLKSILFKETSKNSGKDEIKIITQGSRLMKSRGQNFHMYSEQVNVIRATIVFQNHAALLKVIFSSSKNSSDQFTVHIPLNAVKQDGYEFTLNDSTIIPVVSISKKDSHWIFDYALILSKNSYFSKKLINKNQIIPFTNNNPKLPSCISFVLLQKMILEHAVFKPEMKALSSVENLLLIKDLLANKMVIIPGFTNTNDFFKSINEEQLRKIIYGYQEENYSWVDSAKNWFSKEDFSQAQIQNMIAVSNKGYSIPISFKISNSTNIGHSFLITSISEEDDKYTLAGYDPNIGYTKNLAFINKSTLLLQTLNYGTVEIYEVLLDQNLFEKYSAITDVLNRVELVGLLTKIAEKNKKFSFYLGEIPYLY